MSRNWNWFKHDQEQSRNLPAQSRNGGRNMPMAGGSYMMPFMQFYQDMDRMFESAFRGFGMPSLFGAGMQGMMFTPNVDISSTDKEYTIEVEVPGMSENDIRLDLTRDGQLCICGEKRLENDNQNKDFHRVERAYGTFSRTLSLPEDIDQENIQANFNNGILTITAPRMESSASHGKRIEINAQEAEGTRRGKHETRQENAASANAHPKRAA